MRLIDADALKDIKYINKGNFNSVEGIWKWIDNAPTVEEPYKDLYIDLGYEQGYERGKNERPQGKWIKQDWGYICSECNETNDYAYDNNIHKFTDNFCPNCGADMRGDNNVDK